MAILALVTMWVGGFILCYSNRDRLFLSWIDRSSAGPIARPASHLERGLGAAKISPASSFSRDASRRAVRMLSPQPNQSGAILSALVCVCLSLALAIALFPVTANAQGAVAVDAVGPSAAGVSTNGSSLSWSHTVTSTGTNLLLTVAVAVGANPDTRTVAVTYNGVSMTSAGKVHSNNQSSGFVELFYLKAPAAGAHTVQVTLTGGKAMIEAGSVSFTGVNQTTPVRNISSTFGSGTAPNVSVASAVGDMVVDAVVYGCGGGTSGQTLQWQREVNCGTAGGNGAQSTAAGASSVTMHYTIKRDSWGIIAMDLVQAAPDVSPPSTPTNLSAKAISS